MKLLLEFRFACILNVLNKYLQVNNASDVNNVFWTAAKQRNILYFYLLYETVGLNLMKRST